MIMIDERHGDVRRQPPPNQITKNDDDTSLRLAEDDKLDQILFESEKTHAREAEMLRRHAVAGGLVARQQGKQPRQETMRQVGIGQGSTKLLLSGAANGRR